LAAVQLHPDLAVHDDEDLLLSVRVEGRMGMRLVAHEAGKQVASNQRTRQEPWRECDGGKILVDADKATGLCRLPRRFLEVTDGVAQISLPPEPPDANRTALAYPASPALPHNARGG